MDISIVIPAYNAAATIAEAIESVLAQSHAGWELIVVDDGSTDSTPEIAARFSRLDSRIRILRQSNAGESGARNTGVAHARYDWLAFLDADDWISPSFLEQLTAALIADPAIDAVHCGSVRVALNGEHVSDDYQPPAGDLFPTLARRAAFPVNSVIVRRSLVEAVGGFDTSLKKSADWDLWQRVARTGARFGAVREVLAYYRMTPNSSSLEAGQLFSDGLRVLRQGYAPDPRVPSPHPDHAAGLPGEVESQLFYLLSWSAGLLIGNRTDARSLLEAAGDNYYRELYPEAVAQCIFEAATLPTCQPRRAWEKLWPEVGDLVESFLDALERHSRTPHLAGPALTALKRMILRHSPVWGPVIEQANQTVERQRALIEELDSGRKWLETDRNSWQAAAVQREQDCTALRMELAGARQQLEAESQARALVETNLASVSQHAECLTQTKVSLEGELRTWRFWTQERDCELAKLRQHDWIRLGLRLRALHVTDCGTSNPEPLNYPASILPEQTEACGWQLHTAGGNTARLLFPPDQPGTVRIAIIRVRTRIPFGIQVNCTNLAVVSNHGYSVQFRARSDRPRAINVGCAKAHSPWSNIGLYRKFQLTAKWQSFESAFTAVEDEGNARIHFDLGGSNIAVELSDLRLVDA